MCEHVAAERDEHQRSDHAGGRDARAGDVQEFAFRPQIESRHLRAPDRGVQPGRGEDRSDREQRPHGGQRRGVTGAARREVRERERRRRRRRPTSAGRRRRASRFEPDRIPPRARRTRRRRGSRGARCSRRRSRRQRVGHAAERDDGRPRGDQRDDREVDHNRSEEPSTPAGDDREGYATATSSQ